MNISGTEYTDIDVDWNTDVSPRYIYDNMDDDELIELSNLIGIHPEVKDLTMDNQDKLDFLIDNIWDISLEDLEKSVEKNKSKFK